MRSKIETQVMIIVIASMLLLTLVIAAISWAEDITGLGAMILYALGNLIIACVLMVMIIQCKDRIVDAAYDYYNESMFEIYNKQQKPGEENES
jgi:hypothetical protein